MRYNKILKTCALLGAACLLASCASKRAPLTYFADIESTTSVPLGDYAVKIEPSDELFITVNSSNPQATALYNAPLVNPALNDDLITTTQPRQQTYIVDSKGDIQFPILGTIHVAGLTTEQLAEKLKTEISKDVKDPYVKVELINFVINVAGEVKDPRRIPVTRQRFSVLDAITAAGDLTPYGQRENVLIIREENGERTSARLDLNKAETLSSPYFFVKQNDYIYVEPTPVRKDNADYNQNNAYKLSVVSTIVSGCSVIASLIIALAIK